MREFAAGVAMTINFSKGWDYYSLSAEKGATISVDDEKALVISMILNCDDDLVKSYATSTLDPGPDVFVRTGVHVSQSDPALHVQACLGNSDPESWKKSDAGITYTYHIMWHDASGGESTKKYATKKYENKPKNVGVGVKKSWQGPAKKNWGGKK